MTSTRHLIATAMLLASATAACANHPDREVTHEEASATASSLGLAPESFALSDRASPSATDETAAAGTDDQTATAGMSEDEQPEDQQLNDPFDAYHPGPPENTVESSEDCLRPTYSFFEFTSDEISADYPVIQLAIEGRLQEAYERDSTLDLEEALPFELLTPLVWSINMHCYGLFDWLVDKGVLEGNWNERLLYPGAGFLLSRALWYQNNHALSVLLDHGHDPHGLDPNASDTETEGENWPKLWEARNVEAAQLLLDAGADPDLDYWRTKAIDVQAERGNAEIVELLFQLSENPSTAIFHAIDASRHYYDPSSSTPDVEAQLEVLKTLKRLGADIDHPKPDTVGYRQLRSASEYARSGDIDPAVIEFIEKWAAE